MAAGVQYCKSCSICHLKTMSIVKSKNSLREECVCDIECMIRTSENTHY